MLRIELAGMRGYKKKDNEAQPQRAFIGLTVPPLGSLAEGKKSLPLCNIQETSPQRVGILFHID